MGGRGASSGNSQNPHKKFIDSLVGQDMTRGDLQGVVEAYAMSNGLSLRQEEEILNEIDRRNSTQQNNTMAELKELQKQLRNAKAQESRLEKIYLGKSGAERGFDRNSRNKDEAEKAYKKVREERNTAYRKYTEQKEKRKSLEEKINNILKRNRKNTTKEVPF